MLLFPKHYLRRFALPLLAVFILTGGLIAGLHLAQRPQDIREKAQTVTGFNPENAAITDYGAIMVRGQTLFDRWGSHANRPPIDGTHKTWSFYPNGAQIVTKGDEYWYVSSSTGTSWQKGSLKTKWASCSNFPTTGVDAYSIKPDNGEEYAVKGLNIYVMSASGSCIFNGTINGRNLREHWAATGVSNLGNHPLRDRNTIDQLQWLNANNQIVVTGNQLWIMRLVGDTTVRCDYPPTNYLNGSWHFCEPETLQRRWVDVDKIEDKMENHPPLTGFRTIAVNYSGNYQLYTASNYVWQLGGSGQVWNTFRSGYDGYGMREPFIMRDVSSTGVVTYYMYYDAQDVNQNWKTAYATAPHPRGPWTKRGIITFNGATRSWETACNCAASVYKVGNTYYMFYLGADVYVGGDGIFDELAGRFKIPSSNALGTYGSYYKLGMARSTSPAGPFTKLKGDGTTNPTTTTDPPVLVKTTSSWHPNMNASATGSLIQSGSTFYYSVTSQTQTSPVGWGIGLAYSDNTLNNYPNNILGPWKERTTPIVPFSENSENGNIYLTTHGNYLMFANAMWSTTNQKWGAYYRGCDEHGGNYHGVGLVMYWSNSLTSWPSTNNQRMLVPGINKPTPILITNNCYGTTNYVPNSPLAHTGSIGMGTAVFVPEDQKLYIAFDANEFVSKTNIVNHMFRNIYMLSMDIPNPTSTPTPGDMFPGGNTPTLIPGYTNTPTPRPTNTPTLPPASTNTPTITRVPTFTVTPTTAKPGDANGDGRVDGLDYIVWLNNYGRSLSGPANGDFNNDGRVDGLDYIIWLNNYGT